MTQGFRQADGETEKSSALDKLYCQQNWACLDVERTRETTVEL